MIKMMFGSLINSILSLFVRTIEIIASLETFIVEEYFENSA